MSRQTQTINVKTNPEETYAALKNAISKLRYSVERYDDAAHTAYIKTGVSAFSWGEKITVTVKASATGGSDVELQSAPKLGTNVVDMGRGKRQLEAISKALSDELAAEQLVSQELPVQSEPAKDASAADEIRKLAQLKDEGIITEEEFEAKKKQLLNL